MTKTPEQTTPKIDIFDQIQDHGTRQYETLLANGTLRKFEEAQTPLGAAPKAKHLGSDFSTRFTAPATNRAEALKDQAGKFANDAGITLG